LHLKFKLNLQNFKEKYRKCHNGHCLCDAGGRGPLASHCHRRRAHKRFQPSHTKHATGEPPDPVPTRARKKAREADEAEAAREKEEQ